MAQPILVCAADLAPYPEVRSVLEAAFTVRYVAPEPQALAGALADADAYYAALQVRLTEALIAGAPRLRAVATPSTGLDHLDLPAAARRGIAVLCLKDERELLDRITATAELAWALTLACARRLPAAFDASRAGCWARDALRGHQLAYKTCGIVGCGRLGSIVADYARAFRMNVLGHDVRDVALDGVTMVDLDTLLQRADVVSIHIHLTETNRGFFSRDVIGRMKPGSILVNTSRGAIVDEAAVIEALERGPLAAYGTDVIDGEWRDDLDRHPLIQYAREHDNVVITPHVGGVTFESQAMACGHIADMLVEFFARAQSGRRTG
ncbi:MAG: 2-hydroxyacid dehydrogenase [Armatimonadota bacterium]